MDHIKRLYSNILPTTKCVDKEHGIEKEYVSCLLNIRAHQLY